MTYGRRFLSVSPAVFLTSRAVQSSLSFMADVIEPAASGRAKCKGCNRPIAKLDLRFGEKYANPYAEGEAVVWFHLSCAALMRPEKVLVALDAFARDVPDADALRRFATVGVTHRRLPRLVGAERASSGRARCRSCHEVIEKGAFRLRLQMFEEGRVNPLGTIHAACSEAYLGTRDILDRLALLAPELNADDIAELRVALASAPPAGPELAKTRGAGDMDLDADSAEESSSTKAS